MQLTRAWVVGHVVEGHWPSDCALALPCPSPRSIPLRLSVTVSLLEGTMVAWVPPPPGNRLFYSFVAPPKLELSAKPEVRWEWGGIWLYIHPWR